MKEKGGDTVIRRKYIVLLLLTLISILSASLLYSSLVQAQSTVTGYVSVPAAAFVSYDSAMHWALDPYLRNLASPIVVLFRAPVQLPHGATVEKLTCYWYDYNATYDVYMCLRRYNMSYYAEYLAAMVSTGQAGDGSSYDNTIDYATVDNSHYAYIMEVIIWPTPDGNNLKFKYAVIEYTLPSGAVGGLYFPVDKFSLLAPYITLVSTIILAVSITGAYIKYRKKQ